MHLNLQFQSLFLTHKEPLLNHRYITNGMIEPLLKNLPDWFNVTIIGKSVKGLPIYSVKVGRGNTKILMWSQMHGNESTTTKAIFDMFNCFEAKSLESLLDRCQLCIIPILNPDGAEAYTRHNVNDIDLNRDAQNRSQPESRALRSLFDEFKPDFCFNLHGQRSIFSAGKKECPATLSFLAPAQDKDRSVSKTRKTAMALIVAINKALQQVIPDQIGLYNDDFNINCVGDTFQSLHVPTILFEAGHYHLDYGREAVRQFIFMALLTAIQTISDDSEGMTDYKSYFDIPGNKKIYNDIIIRNVKLKDHEPSVDIAIQYEEILKDGKIIFQPKIDKIKTSIQKFAHKTIFGHHQVIQGENKDQFTAGNAIDFVIINNEKYSLKTDKS